MADSFNPQEFINPKSMLTPGVAGGLTMIVVNGVTSAFPEIPPRYLALGLSLLLALIVLSSQEMQKVKAYVKLAYWLLNGLIIFAVGFGSANLAAEAAVRARAGARPGPPVIGWVSQARAQPPPAEQPAPAPPANLAQPAGPRLPSLPTQPPPISNDAKLLENKIMYLERENLLLKKKIISELGAPPKKEETKQAEQPFFKKW